MALVRRRAAQLDRQPRLLRALRVLRRRLPGDERFGDPLSTAADTTVSYLARGVSVLRPDGDSVFGEIGMTGLQLWQSLSESAGRGRGEQDLALLYTDIVDFSSWALLAGDTAAVSLLQEVGQVIDTAVRGHRGRIVKRLGDGVIATFMTAAEAVEAALEIQEALVAVEVAGHRPRLRAGVHWGRPRRLGGEYLGVDLSIATAVGEGARGGQLLVTEPALAQLADTQDELRIGRRKRLRGAAAPRELQVAVVRRRR
jgi:adenylate cyclase